MTRVLDALKALETRRAAEAPAKPRDPHPLAPAAHGLQSPPPLRREPADAQTEAARRAARAHAVANMCLLPTVPVVADHYHELAERVGEQLATNYCNVLLFVSPDDAAEPGFSMTHLAQAFSLLSAGDVLLVDGDLHRGRLSKSVCPTGPGLIEAMHGTAQWPEIIHPTTTPRVDFVRSGEGQAPAKEPPDFGWGALRPRYRAVLIGIADTRAAETAWLAAHCDGVYVLISRPHTKRHAAAEAVERLRHCGVHLMGSILVND
jgi:Mrp family chromosome partitioning ATPase